VVGLGRDESRRKPYAFAARKLAVSDALRRRGIVGECVDGLGPDLHRVRFALHGTPLTSLVVPLVDASAVEDAVHEHSADSLAVQLQQLVQQTGYRRFEMVLVGPRPLSATVATLLDGRVGAPVRSVSCDVTDLGVMVNLGAADARGDYLVVLTPDMQAMNDEWLSSLLEHSQQAAIGAAGAQLFRADGSLWQAGVVLPRGVPIGVRQDIILNPGDCPECLNVTNFSAVSGGCVMTRRDVFDEVGGFRPAHAVGFSDVDYCLRVRQRGYRIVFTPFARLCRRCPPRAMFAESGISAFRRHWGEYSDPYYNPNLLPDGSFRPSEE